MSEQQSDSAEHLVWSAPTRYTVVLIALAGGITLLVYARALVGSLVIAALLAYILTPLVVFVSRATRLSHRWAAVVVYAGLLLVLLAIPGTLTPSLISRATTLTDQLQDLNDQVDLGVRRAADFLGIDVPEDFLAASTQLVAFDDVMGIIGDVTTNLTWVLVTLVTTFYLLQDWHLLREWMIRIAPKNRQPEVRRLYVEIRNVWSAYVRGQLVLMLIIGLFSGIGAALLGVRGAWALGILAGVLDAVPTLGPALAAVAAVLVAFLQGSSILDVPNGVFALIVLGLYGVIQGLENVWLRPRIMGSSLRMHPGIVFVGVMGSLALAGILVTLIIVPLIGTVGVLGRYAHARILGLDPWRDEVQPIVVTEAHGSQAARKNPPHGRPD